MKVSATIVLLASLVLVNVGSLVHAHENGHASMDMADMIVPFVNVTSNSTDMILPSYFRHPEYSSLMLAHIVLMAFAWIVVLPLVVMFSIVRSWLRLPAQFGFLLANTVGVLLGTIYNSNTPDLYPDNAHHTFGWILTWIACAQAGAALISAYVNRRGELGHTEERSAFIPISVQVIAEHERLQGQDVATEYRFSNDSGQGTERNTESLRSQSESSAGGDSERRTSNSPLRYDVAEDSLEKDFYNSGNWMDRFLPKKLPSYISSRTLRIITTVDGLINRVILMLGFVALATGLVTYGGIFQGSQVFSGLAHFIKGSVFLWYGILTLGRWAGSFADLGWAWNIKPSTSIVGRRNASIPSAEFVESFLIFLYGSTNVFLEHLGSSDGVWSAQDLEHVSITIMFFGGGLCGMLIESRRVRDLLNITISAHMPDRNRIPYGGEATDEAMWKPPRSYGFSMNPLPGLVILLLGMMMSSHHQASMVSTMIHNQWGMLLIGAAFARAATYVIFYIAPPTSLLPSRPPSELITAFCLMAGGLIFMASSHDTVEAMELNDIDAMVVFTVTMGVVTILMAWIILVIAIKGWALRKKNSHH